MKYRHIVENKDPAHRREPAPDDQAMAVVNARDVVEPQDLSNPGATCLIKMTEPSIEALRQAFLDPVSRVRLNSDPAPGDHVRLEAIAWEGGFLDGLRIRLSENLTAIIGGRGTGKSTIIESLRYVLEMSPVGPEARKNHEGIVARVLRPGTTVYLRLFSPHPSPKTYIVERTHPRRATVYDELGAELKLRPLDLVPGLQILGQHEIGELAGDPRLTGRLFARFVADTSSLESEREALRQGLEENRAEIHRLEKLVEAAEKKLLRLPSLEERLSRYKAAGYEEKTSKKTDLDAEEQIIKSVFDQLDDFDAAIAEFGGDLELDTDVASDKDTKSLPGVALLTRIGAALEKLEEARGKALASLESSAKAARSEVKRIQAEWKKKRATPVNAEYDKLLKKLKAESVDADEYVRLQAEVKGLGPVKKKRTQLRRKLAAEKKKRPKLVAALQENGESLFALHETAAKRVSRQLKGMARLTLCPEGDREPFFTELRGQVGGRLQETIDAIARLDSFSVGAFVQSCRAGSETLKGDYQLTDHQAGLVINAGEELFLRLEELNLPHTAGLELNVSADPKKPEWREMSRLSTGQRATAALLLLLIETEAPLIVDQPEDDLDNRFIADGIVPRLRKEKLRRQFLFSTHNANVPVLGDAELILGIDAEGDGESGIARVPEEWRGSIDCPSIQDVVESILEGGKAAFETRRQKYGF